MKNALRRLLVLAACLTLLPLGSLASDAPIGYRFTAEFKMDASAYPEEDQSLVTGVAELLNMLTLSGTLAVKAPAFDVNFSFLLDGDAATKTGVRLYGTDTHYMVESSLLGNEKLMLNNLALLEFAIKAYNHLGMPLQYPALLISPYATSSAFDWIRPQWLSVMAAEDGPRLIARDDVMELASYIAENAENDRAFYYWLASLGLESGYSDAVLELLSSLPDWLDSFMDEDGINVSMESDVETWTTGEETLLTHTFADKEEIWFLTLPTLYDGTTFAAQLSRNVSAGDYALAVQWVNEEEEDTVLDADILLSGLTDSLPMNGHAALSVSLSGNTVQQPLSLAFNLDAQNGVLSLCQLDAKTGAQMLRVTCTLVPETYPSPVFSSADLDGLNLFSLNDASLKEFVGNVMQPFIRGAIPLLAKMPLSSYETMFALVDQYGLLSMLTSGME